MGIEEDTGVRESSPYNLVFDLAENLKAGREESKIWLLNLTYQYWANEMVARRALVTRPTPLQESFEKPLFGVFCAQLRLLGVEIAQDEEERAFEKLMPKETRVV